MAYKQHHNTSTSHIIQRCRLIADIILDRVECLLKATQANEEAVEYIPLLGSKKSIAETLVTLAELVALLDKIEQSVSMAIAPQKDLSKHDAAILKRFENLHDGLKK